MYQKTEPKPKDHSTMYFVFLSAPIRPFIFFILSFTAPIRPFSASVRPFWSLVGFFYPYSSIFSVFLPFRPNLRFDIFIFWLICEWDASKVLQLRFLARIQPLYGLFIRPDIRFGLSIFLSIFGPKWVGYTNEDPLFRLLSALFWALSDTFRYLLSLVDLYSVFIRPFRPLLGLFGIYSVFSASIRPFSAPISLF